MKTWVDIHNTVHKFITHPSSSKFQLPVLYSVKWHDKCNSLKSYCKETFQHSCGGNENWIQDMYQSWHWVSWLKFKTFWIQIGRADHALWCSVKQASLQWTAFSRHYTSYWKFNLCPLYHQGSQCKSQNFNHGDGYKTSKVWSQLVSTKLSS